MKKNLLLILSLFTFLSLKAQISLVNPGTPVVEDFNNMGTTSTASLPAAWKVSPPTTTAPSYNAVGNFTATTQQASSGSPTSGGRYNWGSTGATDRALGFMTSGSYGSPSSVMVAFQNGNSNPLSSIAISYVIERYRINTAAASVQLYYSTDGQTWISAASGDVATTELPAGTNTYNFTTGTIVNKSLSISGLSIAPNALLYLRWNFNTTGTNSQGLGLDNFSITPAFTAPTPFPTINSSLVANATYGTPANPYTITASNNPLSFAATGLPAGLSINTTTGVIAGTPTTSMGSPFAVSISATNSNGTGTATLSYTINTKTLNITGLSANNKPYDGNTNATLSGTAVLTGLVGADNVFLNGAPVATFADAGAGNAKPVTVNGYTINGTAAVYYSLVQPAGLTANIIAPAVPTPVFISQYYEGTSVNKWIELTNPTDAPINTASPQLKLGLYSASGDAGNIVITANPTQTLNLNVMIPAKSSVLIGNTGNGTEVPYLTAASASQTSNSVINFNGNDGIGLLDAANNLLDAFGEGVNAKDVSYVRKPVSTTTSSSFNANDWTRTSIVIVQNAADLDDPDRLGVHLQPDLPLCVSPTTQATALNFTSSTKTISLSYTPSADAQQYLIVRSLNANPVGLPVDGTVYLPNSAFGSGIVAGNTAEVTFNDANLLSGSTYYYTLFVYNNTTCDGGPKYLSANPLTGFQATVPLPVCVSPTAKATNFIINYTNYNLIQGAFTPVSGVDEYVVVMSKDSVLTATPSNGSVYEVGDAIGGGIIIKRDAGANFNRSNLQQNTNYYFFIYSLNSNCTAGPLYNPTALLGRQKTAVFNANALNYYYGNLHSHSSYSDGNKDNTNNKPEQDYAFAKNSMKMDFLGISEHNHTQAGMHLANWKPGADAAKNATTPNFVALHGMEWGVISGGGHVIVYGIDSLIGWEPGEYDIYVPKSTYAGTNGLFNAINRHGLNAIATLAHPNTTDFNNISAAYDASADQAIVGSALESGPAFSTNLTYSDRPSSMSYLNYYNKMLSQGYHLGASLDHDNHNLTFGRHTTGRLVILAPALTENDLLDGMKKMRFYATEDSAARISFTINEQPIGSQFTASGLPHIAISSATTNPVTSVKIIYGNPGNGINPIALAEINAGSFLYTDSTITNLTTGYYYADITEADGSRTITSPIWYTRDDSFKIEQSLSFDPLATVTYGVNDINPVAISSAGLSVTYSSSDSTIATIVNNKIHIKGAGTVTITASNNGNMNTKPATPINRTFIIDKAPLSIIALDQTKVYGSANPALTLNYQGFVYDETPLVLTTPAIVSTTTNQFSQVGTYPIEVSGAASTNYTISYTSATLSITQAMQSLTFDALATVTYGATDINLVATSSAGLPVTFNSSDTTIATIVNNKIHINAAGTVTIAASNDGNVNVKPATPINLTLSIAKAPLSILALDQTKVYGTPNPALTLNFQGFVYGETTLVLTAPAIASTTADQFSQVGNYPIEVSGATSKNYTISYTAATLNITQASQSLTLNAFPEYNEGDADVTLPLNSSVGLVVNYQSSNTSVVTINANTLHLVGPGVAVITAAQVGSINYLPANSISQPIKVNVLPTPLITANGPLSFCPQGQVTLSTGNAAQYQWLKNGQLMAGATQPSLVVNQSGEYRVEVSYGNGFVKRSEKTFVKVEDLEAPVARTKNITVALVNGTASITTSIVNNGTTDNCGILSLSLSKTVFDCSNIGINEVIFTATDVNGNSASTHVNVTVTGVISPADINVSRLDGTYTGLASNVIALGYGAQSLVLEATNGQVSGNQYDWVSSPYLSSLHSSKTNFNPTSAGNYQLQVAITNASGCISTKSITIQVIDARCGSKGDKVLLCKKDDKDNKKSGEICVSPNAVNAQLKNGATLGACSATGTNNISTAAAIINSPSTIEMKSLDSSPLLVAYPNPFGVETTVNFTLPTAAQKVSLVIFDLSGKKVSNLYEGKVNANQLYSFKVNMLSLKGSVFIVTLTTGDKVYTFKMIRD